MRNFFAGLRFLATGFGFWAKRPKVMLLGAIPALVASILIGGSLILLAVNISDLSLWLTGFADGWDDFYRASIQVVAGVVVFGLALWLAVVGFTALTLLIGDPFYEAIAGRVEAEYGGVAEADGGFWSGIGQSIVDSLRLFGKSMVMGVLLFVLGLIPVVGPVLTLIIGAFVGGWFLSVELCSYAFNRRGLRYAAYRKLLAGKRGLALGLGTPVFLMFLIPLGAVIVMPAAVAGATVMVRQTFEAQDPSHVVVGMRPPG